MASEPGSAAGAVWTIFERDDVWVERLGRFDWQVMAGEFQGCPVSVYVGKPHRFRWAARRHARRHVSYSPRRHGLSEADALRAIGVPSEDGRQ